jgi:hypothetical protein
LDKISSCLIPVNNLLLKCTNKFLFIFSILPWMLWICRELCLLVYKKHSNKLSGEVFPHTGWVVPVFHQIIILYIGNFRLWKAILAIFSQKISELEINPTYYSKGRQLFQLRIFL